jgi:hypothetical protein
VSSSSWYTPSRSEPRRPISDDTEAEIKKALDLAAHFRNEKLTLRPEQMVQTFVRDIREPLAITNVPEPVDVSSAVILETPPEEPDYDPDTTESVAPWTGREVDT